jgi:hypothetical protein
MGTVAILKSLPVGEISINVLDRSALLLLYAWDGARGGSPVVLLRIMLTPD